MFIKTTFTRSFSLCILILCSGTLIAFSQTNSAPVTQEAAAAENVMPVKRTLTSADGRTIDVVITAKTATGIKAMKADGKEFEITLDKLADSDVVFVAGLVAAPVNKPRVLMISNLIPLTTKLEKAGFDIAMVGTIDELKVLTDQELESFDAIIETRAGVSSTWNNHQQLIPEGTDKYIQRDRILKLTDRGKVVAWRTYHNVDKKKFIKDKRELPSLTGKGEYKDEEPFIDVQGNTIFYSWTKSNDKTGGEISDDSIFDQVVVELKRLVQQKALVQKLPK